MKYTITLKYLVVVLVAATTLASCKEERTTFEINGTIENAGKDTIALLMNNEKGMATITIAKIENGSFKMEGTVSQPTKASIRLNGKNTKFILENEVYNIDVKKDRISIKGGEINDLVYGYRSTEEYQQAANSSREVRNRVFANLDMMDKEAVEKADAEVRAAEVPLNRLKKVSDDKIMNGDYPTLAKIYVLSDNYDAKTYDVDTRMSLYKEYANDLGGNEFAEELLRGIEQSQTNNERKRSVGAGKPYKDVIAHTVDGDAVKLSDVISKNKYTLLEFWASWCGPCRGQFPHLKEAYNKYNPKGFEIYGLSIDDQKKSWLKAIKEEDVPWIDVVDLNGIKSKAAVDYVITGIPASFLIDQNGTIVATGIGGFALDKKLEELFGE